MADYGIIVEVRDKKAVIDGGRPVHRYLEVTLGRWVPFELQDFQETLDLVKYDVSKLRVYGKIYFPGDERSLDVLLMRSVKVLTRELEKLADEKGGEVIGLPELTALIFLASVRARLNPTMVMLDFTKRYHPIHVPALLFAWVNEKFEKLVNAMFNDLAIYAGGVFAYDPGNGLKTILKFLKELRSRQVNDEVISLAVMAVTDKIIMRITRLYDMVYPLVSNRMISMLREAVAEARNPDVKRLAELALESYNAVREGLNRLLDYVVALTHKRMLIDIRHACKDNARPSCVERLDTLINEVGELNSIIEEMLTRIRRAWDEAEQIGRKLYNSGKLFVGGGGVVVSSA